MLVRLPQFFVLAIGCPDCDSVWSTATKPSTDHGTHPHWRLRVESAHGGISTCKVAASVESRGGGSGISKSEESPICHGYRCAGQSLSGRAFGPYPFPCVDLDVSNLHGRLGPNLLLVLRADLVAIVSNAPGYMQGLGIAVGYSEAQGLCRQFLGSLKEQGLTGTRLLNPFAHLG